MPWKRGWRCCYVALSHKLLCGVESLYLPGLRARVHGYVCVCARMFVGVCERVHVWACVSVGMHWYVCVHM